VKRDVSLFEAPAGAARQTGGIVDMIVTTLGQVISGRRSIKELGGPLKIAQVSGEQFVFFLYCLCLNLLRVHQLAANPYAGCWSFDVVCN